MNGTTPTTQDTPDKGRLQINLVSDISAYPIQGAQISIFYTGVPEAQLEQLTTDSSVHKIGPLLRLCYWQWSRVDFHHELRCIPGPRRGLRQSLRIRRSAGSRLRES